MARVIKGDDLSTAVMQPDRSIVEKNDGTLEGVVVFKSNAFEFPGGQAAITAATYFNLPPELLGGGGGDSQGFPDIGDVHPDDSRLECYNLAITKGAAGVVTCQASYFGVVPSQYQVSYTGGSNSEPIETHPRFDSIAGSPNLPKNDAEWDTETGEFLGFSDGQYQGVEYYLTPSNTLSITYWLDKAPNLQALMSVYGNPLTLNGGRENTSLIVLPNVVSWLLVSIPTRKVGNFYQVTEQWIGSGNLRGWNTLIYKNQQGVEEEEDAE